jgi:hypothetical protein
VACCANAWLAIEFSVAGPHTSLDCESAFSKQENFPARRFQESSAQLVTFFGVE